MAHRSGVAATAVVAALALAACGGGSDGAESDTTSAPATAGAAESDADTSSDDTDTSDGPAATEPDSADDSSADSDSTGDDGVDDLESGSGFVPGDIGYRAVNLTDEPVDLYVRTNGVIEAFLVEEGFAPGAVSDFVAPPEDRGRFLVTTAGAGDATCVVDCDHFIAELTAFPEEGPVRTVLLYPGEDGSPEEYEFWELPTDDAIESGNSMIAADPSMAIAAVSAVAIVEPDFGYRISDDVTEGCLVDITDSDLLIGGNQVIPYDLASASEFTLHAFEDQECSEDPVGGPFSFDGEVGTRSHVMLNGTPGSIEALVLPMIEGPSATATSPTGDDGDSADSGDDAAGDESVDDAAAGRDEAIALMAAEVTATFGLGEPESTCAATLLVDSIGADVLVVDGALVDLDSFPDEINQLAGEALVTSVGECGIDPSVYG